MKNKTGIITFLFTVFTILTGCSKPDEQASEVGKERVMEQEDNVNDREQSLKEKPEKNSLEITEEKAWNDIEYFLSVIQDEDIEALTSIWKNSAQYNMTEGDLTSQMEELVALYKNILDFQSDKIAELDSHQKDSNIFIFKIIGVKDEKSEHPLILHYTENGLIYRTYIIDNFTVIDEFGNRYFQAIKEKNGVDLARVLHLDEVKEQHKIQKLFENYDSELDMKSIHIKELSYSNIDAMGIEFILADGNGKEHIFKVTKSGSYISISDSYQENDQDEK